MDPFDAVVKLDVTVLATPRLLDKPHDAPKALPSSSSSLGHHPSRRLPPEVRRARHRDRMQRQRLLEKKSIELKRLEVHRLSRELTRVTNVLLRELSEATCQADDLSSPDGDEADLNDKHKRLLDASTATQCVQQRYVRLVMQQGTIAEENRQLTARFHEWQRFRHLLAVEQERVAPLDARSGGPHALGTPARFRAAGHWLTFVPEEPVLFYQPLSKNACHELVFTGYQRMQEVARGPGARDLYNEAFGWKVRFSMSLNNNNSAPQSDGQLGQAQMQHRFSKRIRAIDANGDRVTGDTLAQATWKVIRTPELYSQMYRTPLTSKIVQRVDARTSVMMRTSPDESAIMSMRFVCLVAQVHDCASDETADPTLASGARRRRVTIVSSILDPNRVFPYIDTNVPDAPYEWMRDGMSYLSFTEIDDEDMVEIEYGGLMNVGSETASCTGLPFAAMNMGEALVRWEQFVTPMRTLLLSDK
ncbi:unnamed protein product [Hyaloperonospora brassicae]|uniref:START domain-containing protein n=1 Tax=Hyaloperonospora brassicae TaxID=162125 RepID=A0AAV0U882_HYABA|nr:unnamed protein product [Hyaloperonospora brassicae]